MIFEREKRKEDEKKEVKGEQMTILSMIISVIQWNQLIQKRGKHLAVSCIQKVTEILLSMKLMQ